MAQAAAKTRSKPQPKKIAPPAIDVQFVRPVSNVITLSKVSVRTVWNHWRLFAGIAAIYAVLSVVFVTGIGRGITGVSTDNRFGAQFVDSLAAYTRLVGGQSASVSAAASVYQLILTIMFSLALIWTLRQVYAGTAPTVRGAYYRSMAPLVPFVLVLLWIGLQLLPLVIVSSLYQLVVGGGIAVGAVEIAIWLLFVIIVIATSLYFVTATLFALFVVTLPDMTPWRAIQLAKKLVAGRRWIVLRKLLFLPVALLLLEAIVLIPLLFIVPVVATLVFPIISPVVIVIGYSYVYRIYRELMGD